MNLRWRPPSPPFSPLGFGFIPPYAWIDDESWIDDQSEQSELHLSNLPNGLPLDDMEIAPFAGVIDVNAFLGGLPIGEPLGVSGSVPSDEVGVYNHNLSPGYEPSQSSEDLSPGNSDVLLLIEQLPPDTNSEHSTITHVKSEPRSVCSSFRDDIAEDAQLPNPTLDLPQGDPLTQENLAVLNWQAATMQASLQPPPPTDRPGMYNQHVSDGQTPNCINLEISDLQGVHDSPEPWRSVGIKAPGYYDITCPRCKYQIPLKVKAVHSSSVAETVAPGDLFGMNLERDLEYSGMFFSNHAPDVKAASTPNNWDELIAVFSTRNETVYSISLDTFSTLQMVYRNVRNHSSIVEKILPILHGEDGIENRTRVRFSNMNPFSEDLILQHANPDFYDGGDHDQLDARIRNQMRHYLLPTDGNHPLAPNFFLVARDSDFPAAAARRLALYDGTTGARAMRVLPSVEQDLPYDGNAYTITSTYVDGMLRMYAVHPVDISEYFMVELGAWYLWGSLGEFHRGISAFRNLRIWARNQRDRLMQEANSRLSLHAPGALVVSLSVNAKTEDVPGGWAEAPVRVEESLEEGHVVPKSDGNNLSQEIEGEESSRHNNNNNSPSKDAGNELDEAGSQTIDHSPRKRKESPLASVQPGSASSTSGSESGDSSDKEQVRPQKRSRSGSTEPSEPAWRPIRRGMAVL